MCKLHFNKLICNIYLCWVLQMLLCIIRVHLCLHVIFVVVIIKVMIIGRHFSEDIQLKWDIKIVEIYVRLN